MRNTSFAPTLRGYLERAIDGADRRKLVVTLTERGRAAAAQAAAREKIDADLLAGWAISSAVAENPSAPRAPHCVPARR